MSEQKMKPCPICGEPHGVSVNHLSACSDIDGCGFTCTTQHWDKLPRTKLSELEQIVIDRMRIMNEGHEPLSIGCAKIEPGTMSINIHYKPKAPEWKVGDTPFIDGDRECEIVAIEGRQACVKYSNDMLELVNVSSLKQASERAEVSV